MTVLKTNVPRKNRNNQTNSSYNNIGGNTTIIQGSTIPVLDILSSLDTKSALSANMGRVLNEGKLSNTYKDTAKEVITFNRGLESKMDIKAGGFGPTSTDKGAAIFVDNNSWNTILDESIVRKKIKTSDFNEKSKKGAALYKDESNNWNFIVDNAEIRGKMNVTTLEVEHAKHIGGDIYLTKAGMICNKVEVINEGLPTTPMVRYKCYFKNTNSDGVKIYNQFEPGDLAFCQTFNNNQVRKWWRPVHGVGENWILVDGMDGMPGSDIPKEGDHIVLLGCMTTNEERQTAVVLWTDAICLYRGINDFVLPEPYIRLDPKDTKIDADTINFLGKTLINNNFIVDENGNLTVKGHIEATSGSFKGHVVATSGEFTGTIKANEGNIGNFTIKDGGLYNDTNTKANITISDGQMDVQGKVTGTSFIVAPDKDTSDAVCQIGTNTKFGRGLYSFSKTGTAIESYSPEGYGLRTNRAWIRGLSLMPYTVNPQDSFAQGRLDLSYDYDMYTFMNLPFEKNNIFFPAIEYTVGKIYILKNVGNKVHTISTLFGTGNKILDTYLHSGNDKVLDSFKLLNNRTYIFINDGAYWSLIYETR